MDLSLIAFAMFKMSSNERLPLCLTENKYNITSTERKLWNNTNLLDDGWNTNPIL
jgi:hypothetical protein